MRAVVYEQYGPPDVLQLRDVPRPTPKSNQVLVRVHAASVNSWDWDNLVGRRPRLGGSDRPRRWPILGADVAGRVAALGAGVTRFAVGDAVFGDVATAEWGGFADYVCANAEVLAAKPDAMTFEQAAAIPQAAQLAMQGLRTRTLATGSKVLINGAGGGVGSFAIQLAKHAGAEVTGVDRTDKLEHMRALGADHVIDHARTDYTRTGARYDLILEVIANRSVLDYARALTPDGALAMVGGSWRAIISTVTLGTLISAIGGKKLRLVVWKPNASDMEQIAALFTAGVVRPVVDRVYPLEQTADALRHVGEGRVKGKVVVVTGA